MKPKYILYLMLVLAAGFAGRSARADEAAVTATNAPDIQLVTPQTMDVPGLNDTPVFAVQPAGYSLQVPLGSTINGVKTYTNNVVQVWLLKKDGTAVAQSDAPSPLAIGLVGKLSVDYVFYQFQQVPAGDLAGIVVDVGGKLSSHELKRKGQQ